MEKILCVGKGTKVLMADYSLKAIEKIKIEDKIFSYNLNFLNLEEVTVTITASSDHEIVNCLTFANSSKVNCTKDHPIWVSGKGWCSVDVEKTSFCCKMSVQELNIGDKCLHFENQQFSFVELIAIEELRGHFQMFDISGGKNNCFFANNILVHDENLAALDFNEEALSKFESPLLYF